MWPHQGSVKVEWNIGKRCNYDCSYCPAEIHDNQSPHTDIEQLKGAVDQLCKIDRPVRVSLTGGEPCVHPRIHLLLKYLKERCIDWVSVTTNGTRPADWYLSQEQYLNHMVFSLHFEYDWQRIINTISSFKQRSNIDFFVNVMAHHKHMSQVRHAVETFKSLNISYAVRRIRWTSGSHDSFDDNKYAQEDLDWLLEQTATAKPNVQYGNKIMHANDIIKQRLNQFTGWTCSAGIESLMINWDGEVYRATCRVGGSLGNVYQNTFAIPTEWITCNRCWCTCAADIPLTKHPL